MKTIPWSYIEKFIIVEAAHDHQGNIKKRNFDIKNFKKFENKIQYFFIESIPEKYSSWERENYHRKYINIGLEEAEPEDGIMVSDADEIPNLENINFKNEILLSPSVILKFNYFFNSHL